MAMRPVSASAGSNVNALQDRSGFASAARRFFGQLIIFGHLTSFVRASSFRSIGGNRRAAGSPRPALVSEIADVVNARLGQ
jgi:hypothetical protein